MEQDCLNTFLTHHPDAWPIVFPIIAFDIAVVVTFTLGLLSLFGVK